MSWERERGYKVRKRRGGCRQIMLGRVGQWKNLGFYSRRDGKPVGGLSRRVVRSGLYFN